MKDTVARCALDSAHVAKGYIDVFHCCGPSNLLAFLHIIQIILSAKLELCPCIDVRIFVYLFKCNNKYEVDITGCHSSLAHYYPPFGGTASFLCTGGVSA